jgi:hypothetical protein
MFLREFRYFFERCIALCFWKNINNLPQVFSLANLRSTTEYTLDIVSSVHADCKCTWTLPPPSQSVSFTTAPAPGQSSSHSTSVAVFSCDRFVDDNDDGFIEMMRPNMLPLSPVWGTAHIGDQVYTDTFMSQLLRSNTTIPFQV